MSKETGGPAFPIDRQTAHGIAVHEVGSSDEVAYIAAVARLSHGMSLRQYAAIKLKVPDSGTDWLDAMITQSLKDDFAAKVIPGLMGRDWSHHQGTDAELIKVWSASSYVVADAMLEARK